MSTETETTVARTQAPAKEIVETTVNKEFTFELTRDEMALRAREISVFRKEIATEEASFEERKQQHKATLTRLDNNINRTIGVLSEGKELRMVECKMVKAFNDGTVRYVYDGKVMEERPLTAEERQIEMGPVLVKGRTGQTTDAVRADTDRLANDEISQAIREETNPRTKHSAVDGPLTTEEEHG